MYIRCIDCNVSTWVQEILLAGEGPSVSCSNCRRAYPLTSPGLLDLAPREQNRRASDYAEANQVDLSSAFSVLLGIMSLEQALLLQPGQAPKRMQEISYDPGFAKAVAEGQLTVHQAMERGNRTAYASRLARRYGLPINLAFMVADNRVSIHQLLSRQRGLDKRHAGGKRHPPVSFKQRVIVLTAVAVVLAGVGIRSWAVWEEYVDRARRLDGAAGQLQEKSSERQDRMATATPAEPARPPMIETRTDELGRLTKIVGPDPHSVLVAYCSSGDRANWREPVELAPSIPPYPGSRLGIFRDADSLGSLFAIRIRKDRRTRRWVAGDGTQPISAAAAPEPAGR